MDFKVRKDKRVPFLNVEGFRFPNYSVYCRRNIESAINLPIGDDDVALCMYPMGSVTWIVTLIWKLLHPTEKKESYELWDTTMGANVEYTGPTTFLNSTPPRVAWFNLPHYLVPKNPRTKYIYLIRNPKDAFMAYYSSTKLKSGISWNLPHFFEDFVRGQLPYGDYFEHVLSWYKERHNPNYLFLSYEQLHIDPKQQLKRIANFLGKICSVRNDEHLLESILQSSCGIDYRSFTLNGPGWETSSRSLKRDSITLSVPLTEKEVKELVEKNIISTWKNVLNQQQKYILDSLTVVRFQNTDIEKMWTLQLFSGR